MMLPLEGALVVHEMYQPTLRAAARRVDKIIKVEASRSIQLLIVSRPSASWRAASLACYLQSPVAHPRENPTMFKRLAMIGVMALATGSVSVQAHHSFPATYFVDQSVEIQGTIVQFLFRNPHSFVHVMALDKQGVARRWAVEWGSSQTLANDHVSVQTLKPGDKVIIKGNPSRNSADYRLRMQSIERVSDHWKWAGKFG